MPVEDYPKFSEVQGWALQVKPGTKVRKKSAPIISPASPTQRQTLLRRAWQASRPWCPHIIVGVVATVLGGVILALILHGAGLDRTTGRDVPPITPPMSRPEATHPWNEDMTVTPTEPAG